MNFIGLFFVIINSAQAFIPRASYVIGRVAEQSGKPPYEINLDVEIITETETVSLKETWYIIDNNNMSVHVSGTKNLKGLVDANFIYRNGVRYSELKKDSESVFFEPFFHAKSPEEFVKLGQDFRLLPKNVLQKRPYKNNKTGEINFEPFVRYSKLSGLPQFLYFDPSQSPGISGLWVEQDSYFVRKIKIRDGLELNVSKYSQFARGMSYPSERVIKWESNTTRIRTLNVLGKGKDIAGLIKQGTFKIDPLVASEQRKKIEEFYSKFR